MMKTQNKSSTETQDKSRPASPQASEDSKEKLDPETVTRRKDLFDRLRNQIVHEDTLTNQRLNWLLLAQGFLFVAYSQVLTEEKPLAGKSLTVAIIGCFGYLLSYFSFLSIRAAFESLEKLKNTWVMFCTEFPPTSFAISHERGGLRSEDIKLPFEDDLLYTEGFPQLKGIGLIRVFRKGAEANIPLLLMLAWAALVCVRLYHYPIVVGKENAFYGLILMLSYPRLMAIILFIIAIVHVTLNWRILRGLDR